MNKECLHIKWKIKWFRPTCSGCGITLTEEVLADRLTRPVL